MSVSTTQSFIVDLDGHTDRPVRDAVSRIVRRDLRRRKPRTATLRQQMPTHLDTTVTPLSLDAHPEAGELDATALVAQDDGQPHLAGLVGRGPPVRHVRREIVAV